jgi:hypothetical protein
MDSEKLKQPATLESADYESSRHRSGKSGKSRPNKRRNAPYQRAPFWTRLSAPMLNCNRCGERYRASWKQNTRCPKCGRWPMKIQAWESVLYTLFFPAALIGSYIHYGRSPRNAAIVFFMGLAGLLVETVIFLLTRG